VSRPLILTLRLDATAQALYEDLRRRFFPPDRNLIPAHLTLVHHLPDEERSRQTLCQAAQAACPFTLTGPAPRSLGRGVAIFFQADALTALHATLASAFNAELIAQDRQRFQPHIVVQNKVASATARDALRQLLAVELPEAEAAGLTLWRYLGGPWEFVCSYDFRTVPRPASG
jgi:2'-5' RNA ligase